MKKVYIIFTAPRRPSILSFLVRFWQKTKYSHIAFYFPAGDYIEHGLIAEADNAYVRVCLSDNFFKETKVVKCYKLLISEESRRMMFNTAVKYMGFKYAMWENLGIVIAKILGRKTNPFGSSLDRLKCSEFVYYVFKETDKNFQSHKDIDLLDVKDIELLLEKYKYKSQEDITGLEEIAS